MTDAPDWSSPMRAALWKDVGERYDKIIYVLPHNHPPGWIPLAHFAASHRMSINIGYFGRVNGNREALARDSVAESVRSNRLSADSLYVFEDEALWNIASARIGTSDFAGAVDGFRIIAPKLKECPPQSRAAACVGVAR